MKKANKKNVGKLISITVVLLAAILLLYACSDTQSITINYYSDGVLEHTQTVTSGTFSPPELTKEGHTFKGWYLEEDFVTKVEDLVSSEGTINLYAKWQQDTAPTVVVTFMDWDNSVVNSVVVTKGQGVAAPTSPTREGYDFVGWNQEMTEINEDTTIRAVYAKKVYIVTFTNGEVVFDTQSIEYGEDATLPLGTPEKAQDAQYTYEFAGWLGDYSDITQATTITANFNATVRKYTVTFINGEEVFDTQSIEYGEDATLPLGTPEKAQDAQYTYEFAGWLGDYSDITQATTITANFNAIVREYTITFLNGEEIVETQVVEYGKNAIPPQGIDDYETEGYIYTFIGWDNEGVSIQGDMQINAVYEEQIKTFCVTFLDYNDALIEEVRVNYGEDAPLPELSEKLGFNIPFDSEEDWTSNFSNIKSDTTVYAVRTPINYVEEVNNDAMSCAVLVFEESYGQDEPTLIGAYLSLEAAIFGAQAGNSIVVVDTVTLNDDIVIGSGIKLILQNDTDLLKQFIEDPDNQELGFFDYDTLETDSLIEINGQGKIILEEGAEIVESIFFVVDYANEEGHGSELLEYLTNANASVPSDFPYFPFDSYSLNGIKAEFVVNYGAVYRVIPVFAAANFMGMELFPVTYFVDVELKALVSYEEGEDALIFLEEGSTFSKKYQNQRVVCTLEGNATSGVFSTVITHGAIDDFSSHLPGLDNGIVIDSFPFEAKGSIDFVIVNAEIELNQVVIFVESATLLVDKDSTLIIKSEVYSTDNITVDGVLIIEEGAVFEGSILAGADGAMLIVNSEQDDLFGGTVYVNTTFVAVGGSWIEE